MLQSGMVAIASPLNKSNTLLHDDKKRKEIKNKKLGKRRLAL